MNWSDLSTGENISAIYAACTTPVHIGGFVNQSVDFEREEEQKQIHEAISEPLVTLLKESKLTLKYDCNKITDESDLIKVKKYHKALEQLIENHEKKIELLKSCFSDQDKSQVIAKTIADSCNGLDKVNKLCSKIYGKYQ
jgi:hypothetical protein